jgi:predicted transcriptional regulator
MASTRHKRLRTPDYLLEHPKTIITQEEFADLVGISQARVSKLLRYGILPEKSTVESWNRAYIEHLRDVANGNPCPLCDRRLGGRIF